MGRGFAGETSGTPIPLLKEQITEMKSIDLSMVKSGLNLGKRMPGNKQEVRGQRNL